MSARSWSGAVAIVVVENYLAFIKRSHSMPTHKGQIGFFGGHKHLGEIEPAETAIRELYEESGIDKEHFNLLGLMPTVLTQRAKLIIPCLVEYKYSKDKFFKEVQSNGEWSNCVLAPISSFNDFSLWNTALIHGEQRYNVYFFPLLRAKCSYLKQSEFDYSLWGASAKMVWNIFKNELISAKNNENFKR